MKKNKTVVTLLVMIIILLVGIICYGGYRYMDLNKEYNKVKDQDITKESTNDYSLFVKQMKAEREKIASDEKIKLTFADGYVLDFNDEEEISYLVELSKDGVLVVTAEYNETTKKEYEIAKDVLFYRIMHFGNGGFRSLCYVTEDGSAYITNIENAIYEKKEPKSIKQAKTKEIVNIFPGNRTYVTKDAQGNFLEAAGGEPEPFFVDINGNIYQYEYEKVE